MGHSFGGAFTQVLLDRGLGAAGVGIDASAVKGVTKLPLSTLRAAASGGLGSPRNRHRAVAMTADEFHYAFTNTLDDDAAAAAYERYATPGPGKVLWEGALANLTRHSPLTVDFDRADRAPLLLIAGGADHVVPASIDAPGVQEVQQGSWARVGRRVQGVPRSLALHDRAARLGGGRRLRPRLGRRARQQRRPLGRMSTPEELAARNAAWAAGGFPGGGMKLMPKLKTIIIGCVDPRVVPESVLDIETGEAASIRNVGGRVTPGLLDELAMLRKVTQAAGGDIGQGWELIVLHHTDCGITRLGGRPSCSRASSASPRTRWRARRSTTRTPRSRWTSSRSAPIARREDIASRGSSTTSRRAGSRPSPHRHRRTTGAAHDEDAAPQETRTMRLRGRAIGSGGAESTECRVSLLLRWPGENTDD